ncbi:WG repeat-containing protein [Barnesiella sp. An55]|uniref:WG repeat-containing protein n=1 Tax=Barnesiella sp. An55 TaxID=1965646 RepID=UPI0013028905|nr:WG repeat-containing protein [Barnesiella sp. An55]
MKWLTRIFQALLGVVALLCTSLVVMGRWAWSVLKRWWRRCSRWVRFSIATAFLLIGIGFATLVGYIMYDDSFGRTHWGDDQISEAVVVHLFRDDTYRVYNQLTGRYTTPKLNWVSVPPERDTLAVIARAGKRGFISINTGDMIIEPQYQKAWVFSEGLGAVVSNGKIGFINARNEVVIPFQYDYVASRDQDIDYLFRNGYCTMTDSKGRCGLIDTTGRWVVTPAYDQVWTPHCTGYRIVINDCKYGLLDPSGRLVYPAEYDHIDLADEGTGIILAKDGKKWQVDFDGHVVQPFMYDESILLDYPVGYSESGEVLYAHSNYLIYEVSLMYGIMNSITGQPITPAIYLNVAMLSPTLFEVEDARHDKHLLDTHGNVVAKEIATTR